MKNSSGPSIDPWRTPASILVHEEYCPFKTTLCFLKSKKLVMISNSFPEIPFCFSLCKSPWCYTLSNAFEMSKNIPQTSRPLSKDLHISWVMDRTCLIHELPGLTHSTLEATDSSSWFLLLMPWSQWEQLVGFNEFSRFLIK